MSKDSLVGVSWQGCYQGRTEYGATCETEALLISQDDSLQVGDAVPRRSCELTEDDRQKLERLNISPDSQYDDANIMAARYALDKRFTNIRVERSKHGSQLSKNRVLQMIRNALKTSTKPRVIVRYTGPGKRNTGDWCFEDGFITFAEIMECYHEHFKGKILAIGCDCSYGGNWVKECMEYLDKHGVKPCAHSAKEKQILISVKASCRHTEVPYQLLYSIRSYVNDKNTGAVGGRGNGWEVANGQHIKSAYATSIECNNKSIDDPCTLGPGDNWINHLYRDRIYMVRGKDRERPAWHYVILVDDEETIRKFEELTQGANAGKHRVDLTDFGQVVKSGWGHDPPNDAKEWMREKYGPGEY